MCKVHLDNPSYKQYYMKNWYIENSCIRIFSKEQEKEVAILHNDFCKLTNPCSDQPPDLEQSVRIDDKNGLTHTEALYFLTKEGNYLVYFWHLLQ